MQKFFLAALGILKNVMFVLLVLVWGMTLFVTGYVAGTKNAPRQPVDEDAGQEMVISQPTPSETAKPASEVPKQPLRINYSGPELWEAVNKARVEHGVAVLSQRDILCTIAAIRLAQIRELGKLDGHEGFQGVYDKYKDRSDMPRTVAEFLISGYPTAEQAVVGWLDTLGHKKLITGGEYVWGCIYATDGFGVAITGF